MVMATSRPRAGVGVEAVTPDTQAAAAAGDGFVSYDELRGPDLDPARWSPARLPRPPPPPGAASTSPDGVGGPPPPPARGGPAPLPLPTGGEHIPLDPNAELT